MTDAILIFTFGPVQSFISEARRAGDLYAGSQILVRLARAAASAIGPQRLVYPDTLEEDAPNKLVAKVPWEEVKTIAEAAKEALTTEWNRVARQAEQSLAGREPVPDDTWCGIWQRQKDHYWDCYWASGELTSGGNYKSVYDQCSRAVDAAKRTRVFDQCEEDGEKDTLSGRRSALRVRDMKARDYWKAVSQSGVHAATLRPDGRERLDTLGAIKRFGGISGSFPSVSSVASRMFLEKARPLQELRDYRGALEALLGPKLYQVRRQDGDWPYDGDLFFLETLTKKELNDSYGTQVEDGQLKSPQEALRALYQAVNARPCPYYAIVLLDGDDMGKWVGNCKTEGDHRDLSRSLSAFAAGVPDIVISNLGTPIYAGGDDVLALAPLAKAIPLAQALASTFAKKTGGTASAGVAVAHHRYPLDAALRAAREAEREAKRVDGKAAVAAQVIKRSGEGLSVRSRWEDMGQTFCELVGWFQAKALSSRFAYDVADSAYALQPGEMFRAELKRLVARHRENRNTGAPDSQALAERLNDWASHLPMEEPMEEKERASVLAGWVLAARFVAQGGGG